MSTREQELERAVADLRNVIGAVVMHLAGGGSVRRGDALFRDLKRIHRHTRDFITVKISGGASRWFEKTLGQRVVALSAELERLQCHAVAVDEALEADNVLRALSDEAVAAEYDRREQRGPSAHNLASFSWREAMMVTYTDEELQKELDRRRRELSQRFIARVEAVDPLHVAVQPAWRRPGEPVSRERTFDRIDALAYALSQRGPPEHASCEEIGCTNARPASATWCAWHGPNRLRDNASP